MKKKRIIFSNDLSQNKKQITLRIDPNLYKKMKILLATQGITMYEWINDLILEALQKETVE